jgi:Sec-independent protein translocase protein TatA
MKDRRKDDRRHDYCVNSEELGSLGKSVASAKGQLKIFITIVSVILILGTFGANKLWSHTNELSHKVDEVRRENAELKSELKDMIHQIEIKMETMKVIETKLTTIEKNLDDLTSVAAYNQNLIKRIKND